MSDFRYKGYNFNLTSFREFVNEFNIFNNQRASAENLNKAVNKLKREVNQLIGQVKILTSKESIRWDASIVYEAGEIVSYLTEPDPTIEEIKNSFYLAIPNQQENQGYYPDANSDFWQNITLEELYPWLDIDSYVMKNNNLENWEVSNDLDAINLGHLKQKLEEFKTRLDALNDATYIRIDNKIDLVVDEPTHVATKKYVDSIFGQINTDIENITVALDDYLFVDPRSKQIKNARTSKEKLFTTDGGFLAGKHLISVIGDPKNQFKAMYAQDFFGTALKAKYADLAEIYKTSKTFEVGDILGINPDGELDKFDPLIHSRPLGVVSDKPGFVLNNDCEGVLIALKGQTPVKVKGTVKAGREIYASKDGIGSSFASKEKYFIGLALESKEDEGIGLVNVKV